MNEIAEGTFTDPRDGKTYRTVKIGEQVWMAENLNFECEGSKCYKDDPKNAEKYGRFYDWETAIKACPPGWHLPSIKEWDTLIDFAGGAEIATKKLKAKSGWEECGWEDHEGTDDYGFSALPAGDAWGSVFQGRNSYWWSSSGVGGRGGRACYYEICNINPITKKNYWNTYTFSVRCIQD